MQNIKVWPFYDYKLYISSINTYRSYKTCFASTSVYISKRKKDKTNRVIKKWESQTCWKQTEKTPLTHSGSIQIKHMMLVLHYGLNVDAVCHCWFKTRTWRQSTRPWNKEKNRTKWFPLTGSIPNIWISFVRLKTEHIHSENVSSS